MFFTHERMRFWLGNEHALLELAGLSDRENEGSNNEEGWTMPNYVTAILPLFSHQDFSTS